MEVTELSSNVEMLRLLVQSGQTVNDSAGESEALWAAVKTNRLESARFLLENGANANTRGVSSQYLETPDDRMSAIHLARLQNDMAMARLLKDFGAQD